MKEMNDEEIMETIKEYQKQININENFEKLEKQYRCMIYSLIKTEMQPYVLSYMNLDDVYQECLIVMMKTLNIFDITRKNKFSTFLYRCIRNKLLDIKKNQSLKTYLMTSYELKDYNMINKNNEIEKVEEKFDNKILYSQLIDIFYDILIDEELTIYLLKKHYNYTYDELSRILSENYSIKRSRSKIFSIYKEAEEKLQNNERIKEFESENFDSSHIIDTLSDLDVENTILHKYQKDN